MMGDLFQVVDPRGITITCNEGYWDAHIVSSKPIMQGNEQAVQSTLAAPDVIYGSGEYPERDVYFKQNSGATYSSKLFTKVIVEINGNSGEVVTAFPREDISGNIDSEELKYVKPRL